MIRRYLLMVALFSAGVALWAGTSEAVTVSIPDVSADPGQTGVIVSVSVDDAKGIAGGDLTLSYDASVLTAKEAKSGSLLSSNGITVIPNLNTAGQVKVSMAGASGIASGSGALVTVTFDVKTDAKAGTYDLSLQATLRDENGKAIPATVKKGTLTVKGTGGSGSTGSGGTGSAGAGVRTVSVSDVSADPGQTDVPVSVAVDTARGIAGGDLVLSYDAGVLTAKQVKAEGLLSSAGITVVPNIGTAGQVKVSMAGASGIASGSGALVAITFDVKAGATPGAYDLSLQATLRDENGKAILATVKKGTLTVKATPSGPLTPKAGDGSGVLDLNTSAGDQNARTLGSVKPGQKVDVQIILNKEYASASGFQVVLTFDPTKLKVTGWKKDGTAFASAIDLAAQSKGDSVVYGASILGGTTTARKEAVAVLTFQTAGDYTGDTEIVLSSLATRVSGAFVTQTPGASVVLSSGAVSVGPPSPDFDGDGEVGFSDFFEFAGAFGQKATGANAKYDLDGDGEIGFGDFFEFAGKFGQKV